MLCDCLDRSQPGAQKLFRLGVGKRNRSAGTGCTGGRGESTSPSYGIQPMSCMADGMHNRLAPIAEPCVNQMPPPARRRCGRDPAGSHTSRSAPLSAVSRQSLQTPGAPRRCSPVQPICFEISTLPPCANPSARCCTRRPGGRWRLLDAFEQVAQYRRVAAFLLPRRDQQSQSLLAPPQGACNSFNRIGRFLAALTRPDSGGGRAAIAAAWQRTSAAGFAGRQHGKPRPQLQRFFGNSARPPALHQHARAILGRGSFTGPL